MGMYISKPTLMECTDYTLNQHSKQGGQTATETMILEQAKYHTRMNWLMAKALVEGKVSSRVLQYAESVFESQKDIIEALSNPKEL